ncbi:sugar phosphate isomerase/epimerase [Halioglobus maricola]|uniref:Sugar phosphate isomerase/epimerase n=1 Tax=Halioglobus maricola TaxID=2601894 RepID=A0A5P9NIQ9_9GAMM|nr:sugar phosphate isomerase/epimerase [Halioglobus maricola]QFU75449.1 sugar phosphate isomerase/epimerase [Halioglobus maricola]
MTQFALQTFTVRKYLNSPQAIDTGMRRIRECGLNAIELAYVKLEKPEMDAMATASRSHDITVGSSQITFDILSKRREWVLEFHEQLGCQRTAVSVLPFMAIQGGRDRLLRFADQLEELGRFYRERGVQLMYHHHDFEFRHYGDEIGLDLLMNNTSPEHVALELDTYWTARGGKSPQQLITDLAGRAQVVHLRDLRLKKKLFSLAPTDCALGDGNLDVRRIVNACVEQGVKYMAIEQATSNPYEEVARSVAHLKQLEFSALF